MEKANDPLIVLPPPLQILTPFLWRI